jgi:hypothetical protein
MKTHCNLKTHCKQGHEFTLANTGYQKNGGRVCKACAKLRMQAYAKNNREAYNKVSREWARKNPRKQNPKVTRKYRISTQYGLSVEDYEKLLESQKGLCAICEDRMTVPCIDHDHASKKVRALLCRACNWGIGHLKDDPEVVRKALEYLSKHKEHHAHE